MKVAIVGTIASSILTFRGPLLRDLKLSGHEVYAFAIDFTTSQKEFLRNMGVEPVDYELSRAGLNPLADLRMMFSLKRKFEEIRPDIVFSYFVKPAIFSTLAARLAGVRARILMLEGLGFVFTEQPDGVALKTKIIKNVQLMLYRLAFRAATHVIFLNPDDRDELLIKHQLRTQASSVLGGIGLDLEEFPYKHPKSGAPLTFLFIGRLLKEKGIFEFLAAAQAIKQKHPEVEFVVLGSTDSTSPNALSEKELSEFVESGVIVYPGQVPSVREWVEACSVFVLPSYREGVPRSTQEAMAIGRPVITTDVPGCRETVKNGENGFLVPAFDSAELAEKMLWFIDNPEQVETMGVVSRNVAEECFDVEKVNLKLLKIMGLR